MFGNTIAVNSFMQFKFLFVILVSGTCFQITHAIPCSGGEYVGQSNIGGTAQWTDYDKQIGYGYILESSSMTCSGFISEYQVVLPSVVEDTTIYFQVWRNQYESVYQLVGEESFPVTTSMSDLHQYFTPEYGVGSYVEANDVIGWWSSGINLVKHKPEETPRFYFGSMSHVSVGDNVDWHGGEMPYDYRENAIKVTLNSSATGADVSDLRTQLFITDTYDKTTRPRGYQTKPVVVKVDFYINSIIEFDTQEESLTTAGFLSLHWIDEYLVWSIDDYNGIDSLLLPQNDIWRPDISLQNSVTLFSGLGSSFVNLRLTNVGDLEWETFQVFTSSCSVDITYFPFDTQNCDLKFTAWSYKKNEVELDLGSASIQLKDYNSNSAWDLVAISSQEVNSAESAVIFTLKLKRKPLFFLLNIVAPVMMLTLLNTLTFVLPVPTGERVSYSITVFLSFAVFITIFASVLPQNSDTMSLLEVYLMLMGSLSTAIVSVSLIETRMVNRNEKNYPINRLYRALYNFSRVLSCKTSCRSKRNVEPDAITEMDKTSRSNSMLSFEASDDDITWVGVVNALDMYFLWFCILFTVLCTTSLACMIIKNEGR